MATKSPLARYRKNLRFWMGVTPNIDGMLQGFGHLSPADAKASTEFLNQIISDSKSVFKPIRALDCGAGIGRVSREVLLPLFNSVDLVEQNERFLDKAPEFIGQELVKKVGQFYGVGLQEFNPSASGPYSCVWVQWVIGYLTDQDLTAFFERCRKSLTSDGILVVKDNFKKGGSGNFDVDDEDGSVCRSEALVVQLLKKAGFVVIKTATQTHFPTDLYPVRMLACIPNNRKRETLENYQNSC